MDIYPVDRLELSKLLLRRALKLYKESFTLIFRLVLQPVHVKKGDVLGKTRPKSGPYIELDVYGVCSTRSISMGP